MPIFARRFALLLALFVLPEASAQRLHRTPNIAQQSIAAERDIRDRTNSGAGGLAAGLLEGAPIHFATEISRVVNDNSDLTVLPIVTRGPTENVNDLLYLRGGDVAIITTAKQSSHP